MTSDIMAALWRAGLRHCVVLSACKRSREHTLSPHPTLNIWHKVLQKNSELIRLHSVTTQRTTT
jgi:hypothetical protein